MWLIFTSKLEVLVVNHFFIEHAYEMYMKGPLISAHGRRHKEADEAGTERESNLL